MIDGDDIKWDRDIGVTTIIDHGVAREGRTMRTRVWCEAYKIERKGLWAKCFDRRVAVLWVQALGGAYIDRRGTVQPWWKKWRTLFTKE